MFSNHEFVFEFDFKSIDFKYHFKSTTAHSWGDGHFTSIKCLWGVKGKS